MPVKVLNKAERKEMNKTELIQAYIEMGMSKEEAIKAVEIAQNSFNSVIEDIKQEIMSNSQLEEIFDEDVFNSTYSENCSRETAECESVIEEDIIITHKALSILDKYKNE